MASSNKTSLVTLLERLREWLPIPEFESAMRAYFLSERDPAELASYRVRAGSVKKLRDEVTPVLHYLQFIKAEGEVRFELGDKVPDCWLRNANSNEPQGLEVTIAQAREQHFLGKELKRKTLGSRVYWTSR